MSHEATEWAWRQDVGNPIRKLVLMRVADTANKAKGHQTWHSAASIAKACGCSKGAVVKHLRGLCDMGLLTLVEAGGQQHSTNRYRVNVGALRGHVVTSQGSRGDQQADAQGSPHDRQGSRGDRGGHVVTSQGSRGVPEPGSKPGIESGRETGRTRARAGSSPKPEHITDEDWARWTDYLARKGKPIDPVDAPTVAAPIIAASTSTGMSTGALIEHAIGAGWISIRPEYSWPSAQAAQARAGGVSDADRLEAFLDGQHRPDDPTIVATQPQAAIGGVR